MKNRFDILNLSVQDSDNLWNNIKDCILTPAEQYISQRRRAERAPWLSQAAIDIAVCRRQIKAKASSETNRMIYKKLSNQFQKEARKDKDRFYNNLCEEMEGVQREELESSLERYKLYLENSHQKAAP